MFRAQQEADEDPARRPVDEGGSSEAEGFELAEHAQADDARTEDRPDED